MQLQLESWYVVERVAKIDGQLVARLVPDHFNSEIVDPVVTISITNPTNEETAFQSFTRFQEDFVLDLKVSPNAIEIWGEYDDVPIVVEGEEVSFLRSPYATDQFQAAVLALEAELKSWQADNVKLRNMLNDVEHYVAELLRRAEAKKALTNQNATAEEAQIDVLQRILNRIKNA